MKLGFLIFTLGMVVSASAQTPGSPQVRTLPQGSNSNGAASTSYVDTAIGTRATKTYVDTAVGAKADTSYVNSGLAGKADTSYVNNGLAAKADTTYVDNRINTRAPLAAPSFTGTAQAQGFRLNGVGAADTAYAATVNPNAVQFSPGMMVSYCPGLACIPGITDQNQRASMVVSGETRFDGEAEEQLLGLSLTTKTGRLTNWTANTAYNAGTNVYNANGDNVFRVQANCTSGATAPVLPNQNAPKGVVVANGTCQLQWINRGAIAAKVTAYFENEVLPGAGNAWTQANNFIMRAGAPTNFNINTELDFSNISGTDCPLGHNCTALRLGMGGPNKASQALDITTDNTSGFKTIWGIRLNGANLASDQLIGLDSSSQVGIGSNLLNIAKPTFATAFIKDDSVGGLSSYTNTSVKTGAVFDEAGGGLFGYRARGTYTQAAIDTRSATIASIAGAPTALVMTDGQQFCVAGFNLCQKYNPSVGLYEMVWNGISIFNYDGNGNTYIRGNFTPNGNIKLTDTTGAAGSTNKIALYGSLRGSPVGGTDYGFGVSPSSLDYVVPGNGTHTFYASGGAGSIFKISQKGVTEPQSIPPANSSEACVSGERRWDFSYEYRCVTTNKWRRTQLVDF